jgi:hypothetical protein
MIMTALSWIAQKALNFGLGKIASGIIVAVLLGSLWFLWQDYHAAKATVLSLQRDLNLTKQAYTDEKRNAAGREAQLRANLDAAVSALMRRHELQTETAKVVTVVKTIERPANEEKLCPPHPALVFAFDSLRAEATGTASFNATQAGDDNAPR